MLSIFIEYISIFSYSTKFDLNKKWNIFGMKYLFTFSFTFTCYIFIISCTISCWNTGIPEKYNKKYNKNKSELHSKKQYKCKTFK